MSIETKTYQVRLPIDIGKKLKGKSKDVQKLLTMFANDKIKIETSIVYGDNKNDES